MLTVLYTPIRRFLKENRKDENIKLQQYPSGFFPKMQQAKLHQLVTHRMKYELKQVEKKSTCSDYTRKKAIVKH